MSVAPKVSVKEVFELRGLSGPYIGRNYSFDSARIQIGRGPENQLVLAHDPKVSRAHAIVTTDDSGSVIENISGKNFILINGAEISRADLKVGDRIQIGDSVFEYQREVSSADHSKIHAGDSDRTEAIANPLQGLNREALSHVNKPPSSGAKPMPTISQKPVAAIPSAAPSVATPKTAPVAPRGLGMNSAQNPGYIDQYGFNQSGNQSSTTKANPLENPRVRFYLIVGVVLTLVVGVLMRTQEKRRDVNQVRDITQIELEMKANEEEIKALTERMEKYQSGQAGGIYTKSQEHFVRGFRDYRSGQYLRAMESFQVVLTFDPDNELAKRYYQLSRLRYDNLIKRNLLQANRNRQNKNYRLCQSHASQVMIMLQGKVDDINYKQAKQYYDECNYASMGRY